jgi:hypothetical protein
MLHNNVQGFETGGWSVPNSLIASSAIHTDNSTAHYGVVEAASRPSILDMLGADGIGGAMVTAQQRYVLDAAPIHQQGTNKLNPELISSDIPRPLKGVDLIITASMAVDSTPYSLEPNGSAVKPHKMFELPGWAMPSYTTNELPNTAPGHRQL